MNNQQSLTVLHSQLKHKFEAATILSVTFSVAVLMSDGDDGGGGDGGGGGGGGAVSDEQQLS